MRLITHLFSTVALVLGLAAPAFAQPFFFTTGDPDGKAYLVGRDGAVQAEVNARGRPLFDAIAPRLCRSTC